MSSALLCLSNDPALFSYCPNWTALSGSLPVGFSPPFSHISQISWENPDSQVNSYFHGNWGRQREVQAAVAQS